VSDVIAGFLRSVAVHVCGGAFIITDERVVCADGCWFEYSVSGGRVSVCGIETDVGIIQSEFGAYLLKLVVNKCREARKCSDD